MLNFLQHNISCRDLGAKYLLYWSCTNSMLLNQQLQGILYFFFEGISVFKVYVFKCKTNATYDLLISAAILEWYQVDNGMTQFVFAGSELRIFWDKWPGVILNIFVF